MARLPRPDAPQRQGGSFRPYNHGFCTLTPALRLVIIVALSLIPFPSLAHPSNKVLPSSHHLTKGQQALLGLTPPGGGSFRPYNHPPRKARPPPPPSLSSGSGGPIRPGPIQRTFGGAQLPTEPSGLVGVINRSGTIAARCCHKCSGMLTPKRFHQSTLFSCFESNCQAKVDHNQVYAYQCYFRFTLVCAPPVAWRPTSMPEECLTSFSTTRPENQALG